jgi:hypothetical protein
MFIIWGTKNSTDIVETGEFYCPHCADFASYAINRVQQSKHVYGLSIGSSSVVAEYVECGRCGSRFDAQVLTMQPSDPQVRLRIAARRDLLGGWSLGIVESRLVEQGQSQEQAEAIVRELCGDGVRRCTCGRRYHPRILRCGDCNLTLR